MKQPKKIIILCLSAIGNTILFTPALRILRNNYPDAQIDMLVREKSFAEVLQGSRFVDNLFVLKEGGNPFKILSVILKLRKEKYDVSITAFPSNRIGFNVIAFLINAKRRLVHKYKVGRFKTLSFLQNEKVTANERLHDVEQNINLLEYLGLNTKNEKRQLIFWTTKEDSDFAEKFFRQNKIKNKIIMGLQPGTSYLAPYRRWPKENFAELADELIEKYNAKILIFEGPDEEGLGREVLDLMRNRGALIVKTSLKRAAAIIEKCALFISTDSGLGHIAAAKNIPTIALFGPANPTRTRPYGKMHRVIIKRNVCNECIKYPFWSTDSHTKCMDMKCLKAITISDVLSDVKGMLD